MKSLVFQNRSTLDRGTSTCLTFNGIPVVFFHGSLVRPVDVFFSAKLPKMNSKNTKSSFLGGWLLINCKQVYSILGI